MITFMLARAVYAIADVYSFVIVVYVLLSWFPTGRGIIGDIYRVLGRICDPYLNLFRRFIPPIGGMVDVSPIVALLVLQLLVRLIIGILL